jgi:hypothetical protein
MPFFQVSISRAKRTIPVSDLPDLPGVTTRSTSITLGRTPYATLQDAVSNTNAALVGPTMNIYAVEAEGPEEAMTKVKQHDPHGVSLIHHGDSTLTWFERCWR